MKRKRYYYSIIIVVLMILAIKLQSFVRTPVEREKPNEVVEKPKYNPVNEIRGTLKEYEGFLNNTFKVSGTVGAAAVITYKGEIALLKCYGVRKAGEKKPINQNTIFRLASVSKSITGTLAGILDDQKIVRLDEKVVKYLPELELKNKKNTNNLTVRHLLSHTSGLIPHAFDLMVEDHVPLEKIIERLDEVQITAPPGKLYGYQNVMYSIYDPVVSKKTQKSFHELLDEKVFTPLGMNDASTGFEAFKSNNNKAYPHYNKGKNRYGPMRLNDRYYNTAPAAGVNASISDLAQLLINLTDAKSKQISEDVKKTIFTPQVNSPLKRTYFRSWDKVESKAYSIGWRIVGYKGRKIAYHGGYVTGYKAEIALCEEEEIGIAILSNSPNSLTAKSIPAFLNLLFEHKDNLALKNSSEKDLQNES